MSYMGPNQGNHSQEPEGLQHLGLRDEEVRVWMSRMVNLAPAFLLLVLVVKGAVLYSVQSTQAQPNTLCKDLQRQRPSGCLPAAAFGPCSRLLLSPLLKPA